MNDRLRALRFGVRRGLHVRFEHGHREVSLPQRDVALLDHSLAAFLGERLVRREGVEDVLEKKRLDPASRILPRPLIRSSLWMCTQTDFLTVCALIFLCDATLL
jgi:hypothetical protein